MNKKEKMVIILLLSSILIVLCMVAVELNKSQNDTKNQVSEMSKEQKTESKTKDNSKYIDESISKEIEAYFKENEIDHDKVAYCITDLHHNIKYSMNENEEFVAASTYKLHLAMLYYDMINEGSYTLDSTLVYESYMHEDDGMISSRYGIGSEISLKELLDCMILYSDNDAAHILYENLGGWQSYKEAMRKYTDAQSDNYYTEENVTTSSIMNDVAIYLYKHKGNYKDLIENMKRAEPKKYLDKDIQKDMPQKYGSYDSAYNSVGFVETENPYSIVVLTSLGDKGEDVMAKVNSIVYSRFK